METIALISMIVLLESELRSGDRDREEMGVSCKGG